MRCKFLVIYEINYLLDEKTFPCAGRVWAYRRANFVVQVTAANVLCTPNICARVIRYRRFAYLVARPVDNPAPVTHGLLYGAVHA